MRPIHVAATIVRLFAICLALYSFIMLLNSWMFAVASETPMLSLFSVAVPIAFLIISVVLWNFPVSISRKITGIPEAIDGEEVSFKHDEFLSICLFTLGVYFLYNIVGDSVYWISLLNNQEYSAYQERMGIDQIAALWSLLVKALFTLVLLLGNRTIVNLFNRLRYGGLSNTK